MFRGIKTFWFVFLCLSLIAFPRAGSLLFASQSPSHATHFDTAKGPGLPLNETGCYTCHAEGTLQCQSRPLFADSNFFEVTDVCDPCHSPDGTYDGVYDPVIGAKNNWTNGVYSGNSLMAGKEKWCASCHDEVPSVISGVTAPNVVGDEDGSYIYGTGWGYYKTGHGLTASESYPASGGVVAGGAVACDGCHDFSVTHIDDQARTFDCWDGCDSSEYRVSYRLRLVDAQNPMLVPWPQNTSPSNSADYYRLCASCHDSGPFVNPSNMNTNLVTDGVNRHEYHLIQNQLRYPADYDYGGSYNSRMTCVVCHNVHGSTWLAMVRDGKMISREPGLRIWYYNPDIVTYSSSSPNPPDPEDLPLSASTGTVWSANSSSNLCTHCHANNNLEHETRTPFQDVSIIPTLDWTGETNYSLDGVHPDNASGGSSFEFRVEYTDGNNDTPTSIQILVDKNDDGDYLDDGETVAMTEVNASDTNYTNGKLYKAVMTLNKVADNTLTYKFAASDSTGSAVQYDPVSDSTITITNAIPALDWAGQAGYESDGVVPNSATTGSSFEFRVKYADLDNEAPSSIQLMIDKNDDGDYLDGDETVAMSAYDGDATYNDGKLYTYSTTLTYVGDGALNYQFAASDGIDAATGDPVTVVNTVTVTEATNTAPVLSWTGESNYTSDGVDPDSDAGGRPFTFRVNYTDDNNEAPGVIQVWIDENDSASYEVGEKYAMEEDDGDDTDYSDGKIYKKKLYVEHPGTANKLEPLNYRFYAEDTQGAEATTGAPVSNSSMSVQDALKVPGEYANVTTAISAATSGDIVLLASGSFSEDINFNGKDDITLKATDDPNGPSATVITNRIYAGNQNGGADNVTIYGFKVTSSATQAFDFMDSTITVDNCLFDTNSGNSIYVNGTDKVTVQNSTFQNNTNTSIYLTQGGGYIDVFDCTFTNNSGGNGGVIYSNTGGNWNIVRATFDGNSATNGGAFYGNSPLGTIDDCIFINNTASSGGGALFLNSGASNMTISDTFIQGNSSGGSGGGGIYIENGSHADLTNVMLTGNKTTGDGGAVHERGYVDYLFCTLSGNSASNGGAIYHLNSNYTTVKNSIIYNNDSTTAGVYDQISTNYKWNYVDVYNTLINQTPGSGSGTPRTSYEDMGGNNIVNAPSFVNGLSPASAPTTGGDYHLQSGSPCIDAGSPSYTSDHDVYGGSRPLGGGYDMGAHEKE